MSTPECIKNIAIVGATGQLGSQIVEHLLQKGHFVVSAMSRADSDSTLPPSVKVFKGDYDSPEFLQSALQGQDVLIIAFGFEAPLSLEERLIDAAGKAGVPWILPNEWSGDGLNEELCNVFTLLGKKRKYREQIEALENSAWIGVANNPWFDYSLKSGWFGIDIMNRKATIYDDGHNTITTTTIAQVCRGVAALLSLPVQSADGTPCLSDYKNKFVYLQSFFIDQQEILAAVQAVTKTNPEDWKLEARSTSEYIAEGQKEDERGEELGIVKVLYGCTFRKGLGDHFHGKPIANEKLELPTEKLEEEVEKVIRDLETERKEESEHS